MNRLHTTTAPVGTALAGLIAAALTAAIPAAAQSNSYPAGSDQADPYASDQYHDQDRTPYTAADRDDRAVEDEIIVEGHYGPSLDEVTSLSQPVSYADLDLRYDADRAVLRRRIADTARDLCRRLGESDTNRTLVPTCRDKAEEDAWHRLGSYRATYIPRDSVVLAPRDPYRDPYRGSYNR